MIRVKRILIQQKCIDSIQFHSNNSHAIYIKNAKGFISYEKVVKEISNDNVTVIPMLKNISISLFSNDPEIEIYIFLYRNSNFLLREKLYRDLSLVSNIGMYKNNFHPSLVNIKDELSPSFLDNVISIIFKNIRNITCQELSRKLGVKQQTLTRNLQAHGYSCSELITEIKLKKAKFYLANTTKSISDISESIGLNPAYFSIAFKKHFLVNPRVYRKDSRNSKIM